MRIHVICHFFVPEIGAPQARLSEMAKTWTERGHEVVVFTGFPNHPTGQIPPQYRGKWFQTERRDGYTLHRHWVYATPAKSFLKKTLGHLSLMCSLVLFSLFRGARPDVILVSSPTFFSVFSAWAMSLARRTPFIFEVRDLWPGIFIELNVLKNKTLIAILEQLELFLYRRARWVVPVTFGFKENIAARGIPADRIHVITNGVDLEFFKPGPASPQLREQAGIPQNAFLALYIGAHGLSHGLSSLLDTAQLLGDQVHFLFVGEGSVKDQLLARAAELELENVHFLPGQAREQVPDFYRTADVCLVPLKNISGFDSFIPSKIFEILGCARPIAASLSGESAEILRRSGAARILNPEQPAELAAALLELKSDPQLRERLAKNGRAFVEAFYDRRRLADDYLELMEHPT